MNISIKQIGFVPAALLILLAAAMLDNFIVSLAVIATFVIYSYFQEKNALILLFVYFPIRPFLVEFNPTLKLVGDAVIFVLLVKTVMKYRHDLRSLVKFQWFELAFFAFCFIGAVSALVSGVSITALVLQLRSFLLFYLVYYVVKRMDITKQDIARFLWATMILAVVICLHGLVEKLSLRGWLLPPTWENMPLSAINRIRIYGLIGNPNLLAYYLSFAFILTLFLRSYLQGKMVWVANIALVLYMGVWFLTYSRGTWLAFAVGLLIYIALTRHWRILRTTLITLAAGIIFIGIPANMLASTIEASDFGQTQRSTQKQYDERDGGFTDRMRETFNDDAVEGSKRAGRLYIIEKGWTIFQDNPVIGTGFATFGDSATLNAGSPIYEDYNIDREFYSDNQYIQVIVQTGIFGVIVFAVFLLNMLYLLWNRRSELKTATVLLAVLLGSYVAGLVYNIWENDSFTLFYFAMLAYVINQSRHVQSARKLAAAAE
ncbi:O-antigen ligase family protein [Sediminibacillus dalangtanensis]|uniref:O-antigen ligase family protein n=1 Tax=Sediminibacillus dalangtanensis TaxID=2729421 RepID=A0ABX7VV09_9BACI|nr:O-antigen ligase family protein [Sediminibacillus dalangtanensis]QTN00818.1 O-antigen ligase family protein [Sediminibacillus dalangtanensis]